VSALQAQREARHEAVRTKERLNHTENELAFQKAAELQVLQRLVDALPAGGESRCAIINKTEDCRNRIMQGLVKRSRQLQQECIEVTQLGARASTATALAAEDARILQGVREMPREFGSELRNGLASRSQSSYHACERLRDEVTGFSNSAALVARDIEVVQAINAALQSYRNDMNLGVPEPIDDLDFSVQSAKRCGIAPCTPLTRSADAEKARILEIQNALQRNQRLQEECLHYKQLAAGVSKMACSLSDEAGTAPGNSGRRGRTVFQEASSNPLGVVHGTQNIGGVELEDTDERWRRTQHLKRACQMYREEAAIVQEAECEARRAAEATSSRCRERQELLFWTNAPGTSNKTIHK